MSKPTIHKPNKITIHCTDTPNGKKYLAKQIDLDHKARGFDRIGYHLVIQPDGEKEIGRGLNEVGAHVESHNTGNIGIALVGRDRFTVKQFDALHYFIHSCIQSFSILPSEIYAHNELDKKGKTCPNMQSRELVAWYITQETRYIKKYILSQDAII